MASDKHLICPYCNGFGEHHPECLEQRLLADIVRLEIENHQLRQQNRFLRFIRDWYVRWRMHNQPRN